MGIKAQGLDQLNKFLRRYAEIVYEELTRSLSYLGEQCVKKARDRAEKDSWFDHTGNLRSSVGYAVYEMGKKKIESAFPVVKEGSEGADEGRKMVDELARLYAKTYTLVVVAAMSYAEYVESLENKDVLASTELWAASQVDAYIAKTKQRVEQRVATELKF